MNRRHFLQTSGLGLGSVLIGKSVLAFNTGTPLFISAQSEATGPEQETFIRECFALASQDLPVGEPLDWLENAFPKKWKLNGKVEEFNWNLT